jgi:hypothetical protein
MTSLPDVVAAIWLAAGGRDPEYRPEQQRAQHHYRPAAPAAVIGLGRPNGPTTLIATWYFGLTAAVLAFAYRDSGIRRAAAQACH